jgi:hypothetical protein
MAAGATSSSSGSGNRASRGIGRLSCQRHQRSMRKTARAVMLPHSFGCHDCSEGRDFTTRDRDSPVRFGELPAARDGRDPPYRHHQVRHPNRCMGFGTMSVVDSQRWAYKHTA